MTRRLPFRRRLPVAADGPASAFDDAGKRSGPTSSRSANHHACLCVADPAGACGSHPMGYDVTERPGSTPELGRRRRAFARAERGLAGGRGWGLASISWHKPSEAFHYANKSVVARGHGCVCGPGMPNAFRSDIRLARPARDAPACSSPSSAAPMGRGGSRPARSSFAMDRRTAASRPGYFEHRLARRTGEYRANSCGNRRRRPWRTRRRAGAILDLLGAGRPRTTRREAAGLNGRLGAQSVRRPTVVIAAGPRGLYEVRAKTEKGNGGALHQPSSRPGLNRLAHWRVAQTRRINLPAVFSDINTAGGGVEHLRNPGNFREASRPDGRSSIRGGVRDGPAARSTSTGCRIRRGLWARWHETRGAARNGSPRAFLMS